MGALGLFTIFNYSWVTAAAIAGGLFYGLAGVKHLIKGGMNHLEKIATVSDLFAFIVLLIYVIWTAAKSP